MRRAIVPGSFDPVTSGHLDVISRARALYDEVVVGVGANLAKQGLFTVPERVELLGEAIAGWDNVRVDVFDALLVDYCREHEIQVIVKGIRAVSDFDYELQMAQMNRDLAGIETLFLPTNPLYSFLSSRLVKEVATYGGQVSGLVPPNVHRALVHRLDLPDHRLGD